MTRLKIQDQSYRKIAKITPGLIFVLTTFLWELIIGRNFAFQKRLLIEGHSVNSLNIAKNQLFMGGLIFSILR